MKKLNLGCGENYLKGWVNVDISNKDIYGKEIKVDARHDLDKIPYPFKSNEFDEVLMKHVLEHLDDIYSVINELLRITKPCGKIKLIVPHFTFYGAFRDPTHKHIFSLESINYFKGNAKLISMKLRYSHNRILDSFGSFIINLSPKLYERFFCWLFPCQECIWILEK